MDDDYVPAIEVPVRRDVLGVREFVALLVFGFAVCLLAGMAAVVACARWLPDRYIVGMLITMASPLVTAQMLKWPFRNRPEWHMSLAQIRERERLAR